MKNLIEAIENAVNYSTPMGNRDSYGNFRVWGYFIPARELDILIAEFNIHFREDTDEQLVPQLKGAVQVPKINPIDS